MKEMQTSLEERKEQKLQLLPPFCSIISKQLFFFPSNQPTSPTLSLIPLLLQMNKAELFSVWLFCTEFSFALGPNFLSFCVHSNYNSSCHIPNSSPKSYQILFTVSWHHDTPRFPTCCSNWLLGREMQKSKRFGT